MSFELVDCKDTKIKVIVHKDTAITADKAAYDEYLESFKEKNGPHEDILKLNGEPTRFVLQGALAYAKKQAIRSKSLKIKSGHKEEGMTLEVDINYQSELVRAALVDIESPSTVPEHKRIKMKREKDGNTSNDLMGMLDRAGVLDDLVTAYTNSTSEEDKDAEKQKNS